MSALGQKQTSEHDWIMSALPPKADITEHGSNVRFVPKAVSRSVSKFNELESHSGTPVSRSASLRAAARAGAQSTPANCLLKRNAGSRSKSRATQLFASSCRPSFISGAASSMYELR